jgi:hypothetical protein
MTHEQLIAFLKTLSVPDEKLEEMALQLQKRAHQLCEKRQQPYAETLAYLVQLLQQGWAAKKSKTDTSS